LKAILPVLLTLVVLPSCTYHRLRSSIVNQASTVTELQYQQVLGNLAMISMDPWALPSHATMRDGSAQIQDFRQAGVGGVLTFTSQALPAVSGSRTVVQQWGVIPVTDDLELRLLRVAYRRALGFPDAMGVDLANDLAHALCKQIQQTDDIDLRSDPSVNAHIAQKVLDSLPVEPLPQGPDEMLPTGNSRDEKRDSIYRNFYKYRDVAFALGELADALSYTRINASDPQIIFEGELGDAMLIRKAFVDLNDAFKLGGRPVYLPVAATPVTREARRIVNEYYKDILEIQGGWFGVGGKHDVPKDACYVGRYKDRYAWVLPGRTRELADFTLKILDLSSIIKEPTLLTEPGGPRFTPSGGR
jgi:hypothetical protein